MKEVKDAMADLNEELLHSIIKEELAKGVEALNIFQACQAGMIEVGTRFEEKKYFVGDLMMAGEIFKEVSSVLSPHMGSSSSEYKGEIVFGTVQGDIHDIGKDLVIALLKADGFEVHDMGVDVPPDRFVEKLKETKCKVLGLSGLITTAYDGMKNTVLALEKAGLREKVTVIIGGGLVNEEVMAYSGADAFGKDANDAVTLANKYIQ